MGGALEKVKIFTFRAFSSRGNSLMQSIAGTCVCFDAAHLSINLVSEIAVPMFPTLSYDPGLPIGHNPGWTRDSQP